MSKAIGMVEYKTVSTGIKAADLIVKTADVELIQAQTVCPGKFIILLLVPYRALNFVLTSTLTISSFLDIGHTIIFVYISVDNLDNFYGCFSLHKIIYCKKQLKFCNLIFLNYLFQLFLS